MQKRKLDIQKSISELNAIIKEANKAFAEVLTAHSLSLDEKNFVAGKMMKDFDDLPKESKEFYYSIIKQVNDITPFVKEKEPEKPIEPAQTDEEWAEEEKRKKEWAEEEKEEKCALCGLKDKSSNLVEHSQLSYSDDMNYSFYYCNPCNDDVKSLGHGSKEIIAEIRNILKSHCKTLSITNSRGSAYGWMKINPKGDEYTNQEDATLRNFGLTHSHGGLKRSIEPRNLSHQLIRMRRINERLTKEITPEKTHTKPKESNKTETKGLVIKIKESGELASFLPKKVWYALFKQQIIKREGKAWKIDLSKKDQITIPIEVVS